jgi:hypothetical protein
MILRFWIDPITGLPHIYNHGVTEDEVRHVLIHPGLNRREARNTRSIMGQTAMGRYLKVVFVPDPGGESGFVVTAYELRGSALKAYRRAMRRK